MDHRPRIFIVEDDTATRRSLSRTMREMGWDVEHAHDGIGAAAYLRTAASPPDIIVVDLKIPGITGAEIIRRIRALDVKSGLTGGPVRVVAYTACDGFDARVVEAVEAGADEVVLKPTERDETVAKILGRAPGDLGRVPRHPHKPAASPATDPPTPDPRPESESESQPCK